MQGDKGLFELQTQRMSAGENVDEVKLQIPKITLEEVTKEYDKYSKALRQLDTKIQEVNWLTDIEFDESQLAI